MVGIPFMRKREEFADEEERAATCSPDELKLSAIIKTE
jgi:hypothetical protein